MEEYQKMTLRYYIRINRRPVAEWQIVATREGRCIFSSHRVVLRFGKARITQKLVVCQCFQKGNDLPLFVGCQADTQPAILI